MLMNLGMGRQSREGIWRDKTNFKGLLKSGMETECSRSFLKCKQPSPYAQPTSNRGVLRQLSLAPQRVKSESASNLTSHTTKE